MVRVGWATDIHLDWHDSSARRAFFEALAQSSADCLILTGDVADGRETAGYLRQLEAAFRRPVYFVLGNHDYFGRSVAQARKEAAELAAGSARLVYLTAAGLVELSPATALVGHDSWPDARLGDFENSRVCIPDFVAVDDLAEVYRDRARLRQLLNALGDEAAGHLASIVPEALGRYARVVVATHIPPYREAAWHRGSCSADDWLPFCACRAVGDALRQAALHRPDRQLLVLCGHTHESGEVQILPNLRVLTGGLEGARPGLQRVFEF